MATAGPIRPGPISSLGAIAVHAVAQVGDFSLFSLQTLGWMFRRRPAPGTLMPSFYLVGVRSVPVVAITGMFIGMVMAVQMYSQFNKMGMATRLGSMINITVVRELGLPPERTNPNGSGISLGHPLGATGAILVVKALYELRRTGGRYALVTMCIGGGQGIAAVFERI